MKQMSQRQIKISEILKEEIAKFLARGDIVHPLLAGNMITIAHVWVSPDMHHARVFFRVLNTNMDVKQVAEALNTERYRFQKVLSALPMKYIPRLKFYYDESQDKIDRLTDLIRKNSETTENTSEV